MEQALGYGALIFMTLIGGILGSKYLADSRARHKLQIETDLDQAKRRHEAEIEKLELKQEHDMEKLQQQVYNWKHQAKLARQGIYEIGPVDEDDYIDENAPRDAQLGDLLQSLIPQLPDAVKPILNQPEGVSLLLKLADRNPEVVDGLLKRFYKPGAKPARRAPALGPANEGGTFI